MDFPPEVIRGPGAMQLGSLSSPRGGQAQGTQADPRSPALIPSQQPWTASQILQALRKGKGAPASYRLCNKVPQKGQPQRRLIILILEARGPTVSWTKTKAVSPTHSSMGRTPLPVVGGSAACKATADPRQRAGPSAPAPDHLVCGPCHV